MQKEINLLQLTKFLVKAKKNTYTIMNSNKIKPERLKFNEIIYKENDFTYRDSYYGFFFAPGQEIVRYKMIPIWTMAYSGGMLKKYHPNKKNDNTKIEFATEVFSFLKKVLLKVNVKLPYRGPINLIIGDWIYKNKVKGTIEDFHGKEVIYFKNKIVFQQYYIGGLIIDK